MTPGRGSLVERWNEAIALELADPKHGLRAALRRLSGRDGRAPDLRGQLVIADAPARAARFAMVPANWSFERRSIIYGTVIELGGSVSLDTLTIEPGPITPALLTSIKVNDVLGRVLRQIVSDDDSYRGGEMPLEELLGPRGASVDALAGAARRTRLARPGRRPFDDDHYFEVARTYLEVAGSRDALAVLWSKRLGRPVAEQTIARWIGECRRRRILARTSAGVGARAPGPRYAALKRKATT